jgi:glycosyltransferase involved in cell wall biosynthesis
LMPRILFVSLHGSPHTARWVESIADRGWDLHMFGVEAGPPNSLLRGVTLHVPVVPPTPGPGRARRIARFGALMLRNPAEAARRIQNRLSRREPPGPPPGAVQIVELPTAAAGLTGKRIPFSDTGADCPATHGPDVLAELITRLKPDLIHSMEFQHCGYLVLAARDILGPENFPPWLATNWGSDIYLFGRDPAHATMIRRLLTAADLYSCECHRDLSLAREMGFEGPDLPVLPNSGGLDLARLAPLRSPKPPSRRQVIMVKGYDHFAGRAMVSLAVLERFADQLRDHEIVMFSVGARPRVRALELRQQGVLNIRVIDWATHEDILAEFGRARMYLGISLSDAISTSVLESMTMGAFPIQTNTSCCDEWFEDGVGGFAIPPDDMEVICDRFERALTDDALVDHAALVNRAVVEARLDIGVVHAQVRAFYDRAFGYLVR